MTTLCSTSQLAGAADRFRRAVSPFCSVTGCLLLMTACATAPLEPVVAMKSAEQAIATADSNRIADSAAPELNEAREKLAAARTAVQANHMALAERLAIESRADAELAAARSDAGKAKAVNDEIKQSTAILSEEMQRNTGVK